MIFFVVGGLDFFVISIIAVVLLSLSWSCRMFFLQDWLARIRVWYARRAD
jgi:hypothetical protein